MEEIPENFFETEEKFSPFSDGEKLTTIDRPLRDNETNRISTLPELFLEWYLFDSSYEKNIPQFLKDEGLDDIFTEPEFMDLMCGSTYMDKDMIQLISLKIPFQISIPRIQSLNDTLSRQNPQAYIVSSPSNIHDKTSEVYQSVQREKQEREQEHAKEYYAANQERIKKRHHEYYERNKTTLREKQKIYEQENIEHHLSYQARYRAEHREELREYHRRYRKDHADVVSMRKKKCYEAKKEQYQRKNRENYEKNKEKYLAQQKKHREKLKQKAQEAQTMCAAYVFLTELRKNNREQYLTLYTRQQNPLVDMVKMCLALQNMDINACPVCNHECDGKTQHCYNQKLLSIPNSVNEIKMIAQKLKQR